MQKKVWPKQSNAVHFKHSKGELVLQFPVDIVLDCNLSLSVAQQFIQISSSSSFEECIQALFETVPIS